MIPGRSSGFASLFNDYRNYAGPLLWLALAVMLLGAVAEGFGLLMIVPLASVAIGGGNSAIFRAIPFTAHIAPEQRFAIALFLFVGAMALRSILLFIRDLATARLQSGYEASLRLRCAETLSARGWRFASGVGQAGMQSLLLTDVPRVGQGIANLQQFGVAAAMLVVQLMLTALLSPVLTAVAIAVLALGAFASMRWTRRTVESGMAIRDRLEESAGAGFRLHGGLKAAIAQGTAAAFLEEYRVSLQRTMSQVVRYARDHSAARQLGVLGAAAAAALLLFVGVRMLALPFPVLIASLVLFARMTAPALSLQQSAQQVAAYSPAFAAIEQRLGPLRPARSPDADVEPLAWKELRLEQAGFAHRPGLGLSCASLSLAPGQWIGISGPSGAGKTTLVDLVAGLLAPETGKVAVDGRPLGGVILKQWRLGLAYVGQEGTLFDDSIRRNLTAEASTTDNEKLWRSLELVGLADRVRALDHGLDENVGDRGSRLSGGERQRLILARALLRRPTLLILDEATAALDSESESAVLARIRGLDPRPAALVIAHRPSGLEHCDSIAAIRHGVLAQASD